MHYEEVFEDEDYSGARPFDDELSGCTFDGCAFSEGDLSGLLVVDCVFEKCDLSMATLTNARLQGVRFDDCRLMGVDFSACSDFGLDLEFSGCTLHYACFSAMNLEGTSLAGCSLEGVDFSQTNLSGATLSGCDLSEAVFAATNLEGADLRGSTGFAIDPRRNRIAKAKFSLAALPGLLLEYDLQIE